MNEQASTAAAADGTSQPEPSEQVPCGAVPPTRPFYVQLTALFLWSPGTENVVAAGHHTVGRQGRC